MPLTDRAIHNAKPDTKPYRLADGGGMYLEVAPSGGKWWRLKCRVDGKAPVPAPAPNLLEGASTKALRPTAWQTELG